MRPSRSVVWSLALIACSGARDGASEQKRELTGAGGTFPYPVFRAWISEYGRSSGVRINYFSVGSAEGVRRLDEGQVDFAATDRPIAMPAGVRAPGCARLLVPMVVGPIAVAYNLPMLGAAAPLQFDANVLADIFAGRVTRWNAAAIKALNPATPLPAMLIVVVHRGVGSGTGSAFSDFLSRSGRWKGRHGASDTTEVHWPVGIAAEGNEGVAVEVKVTEGSIGYVELAYARQNRLSVAAVKGQGAEFAMPGSGAPEYPVTARTWLVIDPTHIESNDGKALTDFASWALHEGAEQARAMEYMPIPTDTVAHYDSLMRAIPFATCVKPSAAPPS